MPVRLDAPIAPTMHLQRATVPTTGPIVHQLHTADLVATLYDAEMPGGAVRFAEFFHLDGGKIQSLRLVYDATEYRARGGR